MPSREEMRWKHNRQEKELREARKQDKLKRNRKPKRVRRKDWRLADTDEFDDLAHFERIMPAGERERRLATLARGQSVLEAEPQPDEAQEDGPRMSGEEGTVVEIATSLCRVALGRAILSCAVRGALSSHNTGFTNVIAVGDRVLVSADGNGQGVIEEVLPRYSVLARPDPFYSHLQQILVANLDQVVIVASWAEPSLWPELIDRYLIAAERSRISAVVCVNKIDLAADPATAQAELTPYVDLGHAVLFTSAVSRKGLGRLRRLLRGRMTAMVGLSGVGKSSLLQALEPGLELRTAEVSEHSGEGRHTTTQVTLLPLEMGGYVVDTPGIREFGLSGLTRAELMRFYPELVPFANRCRFTNCSHTHEPGCAVKAAVARGRLSPMRYHSYERIYESLPG